MSPSAVIRWLEGLSGPQPYLAVFAVAFAEHALLVGTFVPGEVILPPHRGRRRHHRGGGLADQLTFWLGRWWTLRRRGRPGPRGPPPTPATVRRGGDVGDA